ncbi:hypothetical protein B9Q09_03520, partial [Candidatus Marsarchaeota G2 archaeon ECH_B_SAG-C16]
MSPARISLPSLSMSIRAALMCCGVVLSYLSGFLLSITSYTQATIKGKKYKGAIVISPKAGVYFDVVVLDFASLYPSILKEYNLSYETVRCPHPECRNNKV